MMMKKWMIAAAAMGLAATVQAGWTLIDNFDSYSTGGTVETDTSSAWTGNPASTPNATIVAETSGNSLRAVGTGWTGAETDLGANALADNATSTFFFQVLREGANNDCMLGLAPTVASIDNTQAYKDYSIMPYVSGGNLNVYTGDNGITVTAMTQDTWYNVWLVVNNTTDTFNMYTSTGTADGTLYTTHTDISFSDRQGTADDGVALAAFGISQDKTSGVRVDNLYVDLTGANTTYAIPEPGTLGLIGMAGIGLIAVRRFRM